jgi:hypothetical protein
VRKKFFKFLLLGCLSTIAGCGRAGRMEPYPEFTDLFPADRAGFPPVILVARILACVPVGSPQPSIWEGQPRYQEYRTTVAVENVLYGSVPGRRVDIYFLQSLIISGPPRLGTLQHGGLWRIGDREMFFLQRDSGRLRTVCDTWAHCVVPVLSGSHEGFQPGPTVGDALADILFTRGKGSSDAQMIEGLEKATFIGFHFAPNFSMRKLEDLVQTETPPVREAACKYLRMFSRPAPYDNPDYGKLLAADPDFIKAIAICPAQKDIR